MNPGFDEFIDEGLDPAERERLRGVHELLLAAGPPPELPSALARLAPEESRVGVRPFPVLTRRRSVAALALAATIAVAAVGGYLLGNGSRTPFKTVRVVSMQGHDSFASVRVGPNDGNGNWPLEMSVSGLPKLTGKQYYELMLTQDGKPTYPCGRFVMRGHATTLYWTVPYKITGASRWVVMVLTPRAGQRRAFTGPVVLGVVLAGGLGTSCEAGRTRPRWTCVFSRPRLRGLRLRTAGAAPLPRSDGPARG